MKISEIITDKYKLRIPPTVYYDLLSDVREVEEEQEPQSFEWCDTCKEYDQEKHCCHRWSKVIRDTVEEMKQEPFKPMVEIDLYSVIKQKYIERKVLDKISAEIERQEKWLMVAGYNQYNVDIALDAIKSVVDNYKAESEKTDG